MKAGEEAGWKIRRKEKKCVDIYLLYMGAAEGTSVQEELRERMGGKSSGLFFINKCHSIFL